MTHDEQIKIQEMVQGFRGTGVGQVVFKVFAVAANLEDDLSKYVKELPFRYSNNEMSEFFVGVANKVALIATHDTDAVRKEFFGYFEPKEVLTTHDAISTWCGAVVEGIDNYARSVGIDTNGYEGYLNRTHMLTYKVSKAINESNGL